MGGREGREGGEAYDPSVLNTKRIHTRTHTHLAVIFGCQVFHAAKVKLRPLHGVCPAALVIQVTEILRRHCRGRRVWGGGRGRRHVGGGMWIGCVCGRSTRGKGVIHKQMH